jgi:hypothetical protein
MSDERRHGLTRRDVLDRDYFTVSDAEVRRTAPVLTVIGGQVVHDSGEVAIR